MNETRLSKNQKDALFILALLETRGRCDLVGVSNVRKMIESSRSGVLDPPNFRKGVHKLAERGSIELARHRNLSLAMKLTRAGRHQAAKIYRERTGEELDVQNGDDEQMTIFD